MRVFLSKAFWRFQRKQAISDAALSEALNRAARGLIDADLGAGLIKQRVARSGKGRAGGYRVLIVYRRGHRAVFLMGFAKSDRANIRDDELETLRELGDALLQARDARLDALLAQGSLKELDHDDEA